MPTEFTKTFQIWCHSVHNWGSYRHKKLKTTIRQFSPKFSSAPDAKTVGQIRKSQGCKMGRTSFMRMQSLVEIGGRTTTGDEKQWCFCLYVCNVCLSRWMSRKEVRTFKMSPSVDPFQCSFHCFFYRKKRPFQLSTKISTISLGGATIFDRIGEILWEIFKNWRKCLWERLQPFSGSIYGN